MARSYASSAGSNTLGGGRLAENEAREKVGVLTHACRGSPRYQSAYMSMAVEATWVLGRRVRVRVLVLVLVLELELELELALAKAAWKLASPVTGSRF